MKLTVMLFLLAILALTHANLVRNRPTHEQAESWTGTSAHQCHKQCERANLKVCGAAKKECCFDNVCAKPWYSFGGVGQYCPEQRRKRDLDCSSIHNIFPSRWGGNACDAECKGDFGGIVCERQLAGEKVKKCCKTGCGEGSAFSSICNQDDAYEIQDCGKYPGANPPNGVIPNNGGQSNNGTNNSTR